MPAVDRRDRLVAIVGPTATGKSALALRLAQRLGGEIVSADSRQVYRGMDIGTAKPSAVERAAVPHHLIDVVDPDEEYSLAVYLRDAATAIGDAHRRRKLPILAGGTGQYAWGLIEGWQVPEVPPDRELRKRLEARAAVEGVEALHAELAKVDSEAASRIDSRNLRRVVRALEIRSIQGDTVARSKKPPEYRITVLGLTLPRDALYRRIDDRVDRMVEAGWVDEVQELLDLGYGPELPSMSGVGYRELADFLRGELDLDGAAERIKRRTHGFARQQHNWFKAADARIQWLDASTSLDELEDQAIDGLKAGLC
ncbi:MAG: tRNA (adenosine(37)-N6)-dimethylallyltransferase MiaA [Chloroflexi bacterium]|nr:tRNA (adenosine(37)-N6)-dimethylallyltransferase MiaA [Chloroflexota bacterium]